MRREDFIALDTMTLIQIERLFAAPRSLAYALSQLRLQTGHTSDAIPGAVFFEA